jgi:hypothetical protein
LASATLASADSPLEISGALVSMEEDVQVRVDAKNTGDERLGEVRVAGDLIGRHALAKIGDLEPGQAASAVLTFPYASEWRPGRHVLPLSIDYAPNSDAAAPRANLLAYLILPLAASAEPALRIEAPVVSLDIRSRVSVRLESADGQPHRARVRVQTPRGLIAPDPPPVVEVPAHGAITVDVPLLHGAAPPDSHLGLLLVAEALEGPTERMAMATSAVDIAPAPAWLGHLRAPLLLMTLILLVAGGVAEGRRARS